jgi:lipopolysaccharide export LptBFGC system permease protein LptF
MLLRRFTWAYLLTLIGIILLVITIDVAFRFRRFFLTDPGGGDIWMFYLKSLPLFFLQASPAVSLTSAIFVLASLRHHRELVAMSAAGSSTTTILTPLFFVAAVATVFIAAVQEGAVTGGESVVTAYYASTGSEDEPGLIAEKDALMLYQSISNTGCYRNVVFAQFNSAGQISNLTFAKRATLNGDHMSAEAMKVFRFAQGLKCTQEPLQVGNCDISFAGKSRGVLKAKWYALLTLRELSEALEKEPENQKLQTAFWSHLTFPLVHLVILFIGVGVFLIGESSHQILWVSYAFFAAVSLFFAHFLLLTLASNGYIPPALGATSVLFIGAGVGWWLLRKARGG